MTNTLIISEIISMDKVYFNIHKEVFKLSSQFHYEGKKRNELNTAEQAFQSLQGGDLSVDGRWGWMSEIIT